RLAGSADAIMAAPQVQAVVRQVEASLGARGRVLLRASGTEPLIRVMVEAQDQQETQDAAERIAATVKAVAT
ncbi:MAG: phosphoglucosamine mutase, partial [Panacagrimonas sp.]